MRMMTTILTAAIAVGTINPAYAADLKDPAKSYFDEVQVVEGFEGEGIKTIHIEPIELDDLKIRKPAGTRASHKQFKLSEAELDGINKIYLKAMAKAFDEYELVETPDETTLVVDAEMTHLYPAAPKDDFATRRTEKYVSEGAGSATITITASIDGETVLEATDHRHAGHQWQVNDRFNNTQEVKQLFRVWSNKLVKQLGV